MTGGSRPPRRRESRRRVGSLDPCALCGREPHYTTPGYSEQLGFSFAVACTHTDAPPTPENFRSGSYVVCDTGHQARDRWNHDQRERRLVREEGDVDTEANLERAARLRQEGDFVTTQRLPSTRDRKKRPGTAKRGTRRRRRAGRALANFFTAVGYRVGERWCRTGSLEGSLSEIFSDAARVAGGVSVADAVTHPDAAQVGGELPPVTNKRRNYELWISGSYGNRLRSWRSVAQWRRSGFPGRVALRELGRGDGHCSYYLRPSEVEVELCMWLSLGVRLDDVVVCEQAPDDRLVVCGEYHHDLLPDGTFRHLFYSRVRRSMRFALREGGRVASGLLATAILREAMTDRSWADFGELVLAYPGHVAEVSVYDHCLGDLPGRNALVWEVRRY